VDASVTSQRDILTDVTNVTENFLLSVYIRFYRSQMPDSIQR